MSDRQAMLLVARRELTERVRQRTFQLSTAIIVAIVGAVAVLAGVLGGDDAESYDVGAQGEESATIVRTARSVGRQFDVRIHLRTFDSPAQARAAVRNEDVDAAVVGGELVTLEDPPDDLAQALQVSARQARSHEALRRQGLDADEARRALEPPPLRVRALDPDDGDGSSGVAFTASLLLYGQLLVFGIAVATGVVEEKASRVVEVLLATINPRPLLTGKILGIGILGLLQLLLAGVAGLGLGAASGALELTGPVLGALGVALVWFVFGYAFYATLYAIAGVAVSRQEDLQASSTPLTFLLVAAYLVVFPALDDPSSTLAVVTSMVPICSPIVMPARVALGEAGAVEIVLSLGVLVVSVALLLRLCARIYERSILRMGRPAKLFEVLGLAR
jgi:ABC-2 type transport system permease protein